MRETAFRAIVALCGAVVAGCGDNIHPNAAPGSVVVRPTSGLTTTEGGGQATFTVALGEKPTASVTIPLSSSDPAEGTPSPASLVFTPENFHAPQTVTVTGVDDDRADGARAYTIVTGAATSEDARYQGLDADDVALTNTDNDTAGVTVTPVTGLVTTESGGTATFTIVLNSAPTADVTIGLSSTVNTEGNPTPSSVTFTTLDWKAPQTVTVTGVDDDLADGARPYSIVTAPATSADANYANLDADDVSVTNLDNDTAGIVVTPTSGLVTTEGGGQATFTVVLLAQPSGDVTIPLTSSNPNEGSVSSSLLTFTAANWNAPQTVTVTGADDQIADGNQVYSVVTGAASSSDAGYDGLDADDVSLTNTDNDSPGVTVTPTSGLTTTEGGGTATFTIVLTSQPTADVTIPLHASDTGEGVADVASVTFTPVNWNAPQTVTITGQNDDVADGNQPYSIILDAATSLDTTYAGIDPADVSVTNIDDDSAGVIVTPTSGLVTTEGGGQATFTIVLASQPTADVTIALSSSNAGEGKVSPASVTFTPANFNAPQTVTVTGVDDFIADGNQIYAIVTGAAVSGDPGYDGLDPANVSLTNLDDDSAGIIVTPVSGLVTTEAGGQATFTIALASQPVADVTIDLSSNNAAEGTVSPSSVTFSAANFNAPQTVTVTGVDDLVADGNQPYTIITAPAASTDPRYAGLDGANVSVTNIDNDSAGILVTPTSGLVTTEGGGTATFTIVLTSQPTADVTIALSSSNPGEGVVGPASVTFTALNFNAPQTVTVTGKDDLIADGNQVYTIVTAPATSADPKYAGLDAADVTVRNLDDDSAGIVVSPTSGLVTTEAGGTATFTIVLASQPTADVTIALSSKDATEGKVSPASLTFTAANFNAPQTVTVTGVDDLTADGNQVYAIVTAPAVSADTGYSGLDAADVSVTNIDDDSAGILVSPTSGLVTTEGGGEATFTIVLTSQPTADVTIALSSSNPNEGVVGPASVTFTALNFNAPQTVTVTGKDDLVADGNQTYTIITAAATSADPGYAGLDAADVSVTNLDDDSAGIVVSPTSGLVTTEAGGTATFTIKLASQPTGNVTIDLTSSDTTEGTVSPASLTFTAANFNAPQTVTVTGVNDAVADGNQPYQILTAPAVSGDPKYNGLDGANVGVTNLDDDSAGIIVNPTSGLTTSESGGTATFAVVLQSQPLNDVTIPLSSSKPGEGTPSPSSLTFTPVNWDAPQIVTVTGADDLIADGAQVYQIKTGAAASADAQYSGLDAADVTLTNVDNDSPGFTVTPTSGLTTTESGGQATFTIKLNSQPLADVTIDLSSSRPGEGTVVQSSVTFTPANFNAPQTVTIVGANDAIADGNQVYTIITAPASSLDPGYDNLDPVNVSVTNIDDDSPGITVSPIGGLLCSEAGDADFFTVVLTSQPTADVTIALSSSDTTEGTVLPASLTFTPANWFQPQTVSVTGVDDALSDGNQTFTIITAPAVSADPGYNGLDAANVGVTNVDNDIAGYTLDPSGGLFVSEFGDTDTFTIVLNTQPTGNVTINLSSSDLTEGTVSPASITFTPANFNVPQTVTVTGIDDLLADGNQTFFVVTSPGISSDPKYNGLNPPDVDVTNVDNDTANVFIKAHRLKVSENGQSQTFKLRLTTLPTANVTCAFTSSDLTEGTVSPPSVTFTPANFAVFQTVTVTGVDDPIKDGDQLFTIITRACTSADPSYNGLDPRDISVINRDND